MVTFYYERRHHNHTPGSIEEVRHLKLQDSMKNVIMDKLKLDFGPAAVFNALDKIFLNVDFDDETSCSSTIAYEDVYNL